MDPAQTTRLSAPASTPAPARYALERATSTDDVRAAQRLRYRVYVEELGARRSARENALDRDLFDPWCEHLVVRDLRSSAVVATIRVLSAASARRLGAFCGEREFDLTRLGPLRPSLAEGGRACIDRDHRTATVAMLLWSGVAALMREGQASHLFACASMSMADGGANAAAVYASLARRHLAPVEYRVSSRVPLAAMASGVLPDASIPPAVGGYLRMGAWVGGEPAWDPEFNTADLAVLLPIAKIESRLAAFARR